MSDPLSVTASVLGIVGFALKSIQVLSSTIENVHDAPESIQNVRYDIQSLLPVMNQLKSALQEDTGTSELILNSELAAVLKNIERVSNLLNEALGRWTKHSTDQKMSTRDRLKIGMFKEERINALRGQLDGCKNTLNVTLQTATYIKTSRQDFIAKEMASQILRGYGGKLEQQLIQVQARNTQLAQQAQEIADRQDDDKERQQILEELRHQRETNDALRKTCEDALKKTASERTVQRIHGVKANDYSVAFAGFVNSSQGQDVKDQDIRNVSSDGHSITTAGVVNDVDFAALAAAMRKPD